MISKIIKYVAVIILLYSYIYSPPLTLLPFGLIKLILPLVYFKLLFSRRFRKELFLFKNELLILTLILFYSVFISGISSNDKFPFAYQNLGLIFEAFPIAVFIVGYIINDFKKNIDTMLNSIFYTGLLASLISCYLMVNPEAHFQMNNEVLRSSSWLQDVKYRGFGFASMLSFAYGITQGIICSIAIYFLYKVKKMYKKLLLVFCIIIITISIFINARIGVVPIVVILIYFIFLKRKIQLSLLIATSIFLLSQFVFESSYIQSKTIDYGLGFFTQTESYVSSDNETTYDILERMMFLPSNFKDLVFGSGYSIFGIYGKSSDVGYVLQIFFGGLVYLFLLLLLVVFMAKKILKFKNYNWFFYIFIGTIMVCNIKGYFISNNSAFRLLILIYVALIHLKKSRFIITQN